MKFPEVFWAAQITPHPEREPTWGSNDQRRYFPSLHPVAKLEHAASCCPTLHDPFLIIFLYISPPYTEAFSVSVLSGSPTRLPFGLIFFLVLHPVMVHLTIDDALSSMNIVYNRASRLCPAETSRLACGVGQHCPLEVPLVSGEISPLTTTMNSGVFKTQEILGTLKQMPGYLSDWHGAEEQI